MPAFAFDGSGIAPEFGGGGQQLPEGKHPVRIVKTGIETTKDGAGGMLVATVEAFDGPAKGVQMPIRFNMHNKSAAAVEIAKKQLTAICALTIGRPSFQQTEELHDKPFVVDVRKQANDPKYHEVFEVYSMDGRSPSEVIGSGGGNTGGGAAFTGAAQEPEKPAEQANSWAGGGAAAGGGNAWAGGGAAAGAGAPAKGPWG